MTKGANQPTPTEYFEGLFAPVSSDSTLKYEVRAFPDSEDVGGRPECRFFGIRDFLKHVTEMVVQFAGSPGMQDGKGYFYGLQPRIRKRGRDQDVTLAVAVGLDFDGGQDAALRNLARVPWLPSSIILSGHGVHGVWFLEDAWEFGAPKDYQRLVKALQAEYGADPRSTNASRVLRIPCTWNLKYEPVHVFLQTLEPSRRYDIRELLAHVAELEARLTLTKTREESHEVSTRETSSPPVSAPYGTAALSGMVDEMLAARAPSGKGNNPGNRNDTLNRAAFRVGQLAQAGHLDERLAKEALLDAAISKGLERQAAERTWNSGLQAGLRSPDIRVPIVNSVHSDSSTSHSSDTGDDGPSQRLMAQARSIIRRFGDVLADISDPAEFADFLTAFASDLRDSAEGLVDLSGPPRRKLPPPMGVLDLLQLGELDREWLAVDFLPAGGNILNVGYPKSCKTMLNLDIGVALSSGMPLLGKFTVPTRRRVGIVIMEDDARRTLRRLRRLCEGRGLEFQDLSGYMHVWTRPPLKLKDSTVAELGEYAEELELDVLLVDSWAYVSSGDSNSADEVTPQLQALSRCREYRPGLTVILTHHARKEREDSPPIRITDAIRNSSAFGAWFDAAIYLTRANERSSTIQVRSEFRDSCALPPFEFRIADEFPGDPTLGIQASGWLRLSHGEASAGASTDNHAAPDGAEKLAPSVLTFVSKHPGCSQNAVRKGVTGRNSDVDAAIEILAERHMVNIRKPERDGLASKLWPAETAPHQEPERCE